MDFLTRLLMLSCCVAGFFFAYTLQPVIHNYGQFAAFIGLGALLSTLAWLPVNYLLKGVNR